MNQLGNYLEEMNPIQTGKSSDLIVLKETNPGQFTIDSGYAEIAKAMENKTETVNVKFITKTNETKNAILNLVTNRLRFQ